MSFSEEKTARQYYRMTIETNNGDNHEDIKTVFVAAMGKHDAISMGLRSQLSPAVTSVDTIWVSYGNDTSKAYADCGNERVTLLDSEVITIQEFAANKDTGVAVYSEQFREDLEMSQIHSSCAHSFG